jgi:hypothetical protein
MHELICRIAMGSVLCTASSAIEKVKLPYSTEQMLDCILERKKRVGFS